MMREEKILPTLNQLKVGQAATIVAFSGGWGLRQRLQQVGLHVGDIVRLKRNAVLGGPLLLTVNQADIALSRCMAAHIFVRVTTLS
ncbi:MAG TPA: FeoA family protein [bacterium]|nr:FeoA family protein [bacterium]